MRKLFAEDSPYLIPISIIISTGIVVVAWMYNTRNPSDYPTDNVYVRTANEVVVSKEMEEITPSTGVVLPVTWNDLGVKLSDVGAIDKEKLKKFYMDQGLWNDEYEELLSGKVIGKLKITPENSGYILNMLWALGLAQNNPILSDKTEIANPDYSRDGRIAAGFASTGGWTMSAGDSMNHYNGHKFFKLTPEQQAKVDKVSRGIYRPCCNNSTHFPDCNHGMAMLGLLELMASQGVSEQDMWNTALTVNSYWFPDTYLTIAAYMKGKGIEWKDVNPEEVLGADYSSGSGFAKITSQVTVPDSGSRGGSGCGVGQSQAPATATQRKPSGCGI